MQMIKQESALAGEIIEFNTPCEANVHLEIDQAIFRQGMSNLGAAVNVITTKGDAGQAGFTASAVCSVTDSPQLYWYVSIGLLRYITFFLKIKFCVSIHWVQIKPNYRISLVAKHRCNRGLRKLNGVSW